jgi:hypothetical protein
MAILDFPAAPTAGQVVTLTNGFSYQWDGAVWTLTPASPGQVAGGDLSGTYPNPTVIPTVKSKWQDTGTVLTPVVAAYANKLTLDSLGNLTVIGPTSTFGQNTGSLTAKWGPRGLLYSDVNTTDVDSNGGGSLAYDRNGAPTWKLRLQTGGGDVWQFMRRPANSDTYSMAVGGDASGNFTITGATATKASGTTWSNPSDRRLKDDIEDYATGLAAIVQLQPRTFVYNGKGGSTAGMRGYGFVADEVEPVMPETVGTRAGKLNEADEAETDIQTLDQSNLILALVNAVKELTQRVAALEAAR